MLAIRNRIAAEARISARQTNRSESLTSPVSCNFTNLSVSVVRIRHSKLAVILTAASETKKGFGGTEAFVRKKRRRLLERGIDRGELRTEVGTQAVHSCDDRQRNAGSDQAVFNCGSAGFVLDETSNELGHW